MTKFIMRKEKGTMRAWGLHHAAFTILLVIAGHLFGIGDFMAAMAVGIYLRNEWGGKFKPPATFEYMDFLAPLAVAILYLSVS